MALVRLNQFDEAADWAAKAAARPNAHAHIQAIAAYSLALAARLDQARAHMTAIHKKSDVAALTFANTGASSPGPSATRVRKRPVA